MTDEEVVADSEDDSVTLGDLKSTVQTVAGDNISSFTENPASKSMETSISSFAKDSTAKPRPKPRPAYKGTAAIANAIISIGTSPLAGPATTTTSQELDRDVQMGSSNSLSTNSFETGFSIAERTKTRSRNASKLTPSIPLISSPSPMARPRPPRPKPKRGFNTKARVSPAPEVIVLTSDEEDELALPPLKLKASHAKSKPSSESAPEIVMQRNSSLPGQAVTPANTRPVSPLDALPSDTMVLDKEQDHPPIAFLPNDSGADIFLSSSPLFTPLPAEKKKRKRQEMSSLDQNMDNGNNIDLDTQTMPPPLFAFSSSDVQGTLPPLSPPIFAPPSSSVNDSGIEVDVPVPTLSKSGAKKPTSKRNKTTNQDEPKRSKKAQNFDEDDFDLSTERPKKKRPNAKTKKGKKSAGLQEGDSQTSKAVKSNEFIDDDEDREPGPVALLVADLSTALTTPAIATAPQSPLSSVLDSDAGEVPEKTGKVTAEMVINNKRKPRKGKPVILSEDDEADVVTGDERDEPVVLSKSTKARGKRKETGRNADNKVGKPLDAESGKLERTDNEIKENCSILHNTSPSSAAKQPVPPPSSRSYSIASRTKSTPMSELIRRVNSLPGSPFATTPYRSPITTKTGTAYSPYLKSSRSALSRIAPLHPNRRTPPLPLPKPPPPKKTKKQLEKEEKWEEELQESIEGWATLTDEERAAIRRAKRAMDEGWED